MKSLFVELQTEELPPKALKKLSEAFAANLRLLRKTFKLSDLEVRILAFV